MKKTIIWIIVVIVVIGGIFWLGGDKKGSDQPIKIGGLFSLSGYAAFAGEAARDGMIMAIEDSGMEIPYVIEDFKSDQKSLVGATSKLLDINKVSVVIGPEWAEFGEVIAPTADQKKVPFISPWMVSETEWAKTPYYFSATPSERTGQQKLLNYFTENNVKKIVVVYSNNSFSFSNLATFKDELSKQTNLEIVGEYKFNEDVVDFRTDILKIKQLAPDGIYSIIANDEGHGNFSKQLKDLSINIPIYLDRGRAESPVIREKFSTFIVGQKYYASLPYKNVDTFDVKFEQRFGHKPGAISASTAYDMTALVLKAIKDGAKNSEGIKNYLARVKDYEGYSNLINFNSNGQVEGGEAVIKQITKEGNIVIQE